MSSSRTSVENLKRRLREEKLKREAEIQLVSRLCPITETPITLGDSGRSAFTAVEPRARTVADPRDFRRFYYLHLPGMDLANSSSPANPTPVQPSPFQNGSQNQDTIGAVVEEREQGAEVRENLEESLESSSSVSSLAALLLVPAAISPVQSDQQKAKLQEDVVEERERGAQLQIYLEENRESSVSSLAALPPVPAAISPIQSDQQEAKLQEEVVEEREQGVEFQEDLEVSRGSSSSVPTPVQPPAFQDVSLVQDTLEVVVEERDQGAEVQKDLEESRESSSSISSLAAPLQIPSMSTVHQQEATLQEEPSQSSCISESDLENMDDSTLLLLWIRAVQAQQQEQIWSQKQDTMRFSRSSTSQELDIPRIMAQLFPCSSPQPLRSLPQNDGFVPEHPNQDSTELREDAAVNDAPNVQSVEIRSRNLEGISQTSSSQDFDIIGIMAHLFPNSPSPPRAIFPQTDLFASKLPDHDSSELREDAEFFEPDENEHQTVDNHDVTHEDPVVNTEEQVEAGPNVTSSSGSYSSVTVSQEVDIIVGSESLVDKPISESRPKIEGIMEFSQSSTSPELDIPRIMTRLFESSFSPPPRILSPTDVLASEYPYQDSVDLREDAASNVAQVIAESSVRDENEHSSNDGPQVEKEQTTSERERPQTKGRSSENTEAGPEFDNPMEEMEKNTSNDNGILAEEFRVLDREINSPRRFRSRASSREFGEEVEEQVCHQVRATMPNMTPAVQNQGETGSLFLRFGQPGDYIGTDEELNAFINSTAMRDDAEPEATRENEVEESPSNSGYTNEVARRMGQEYEDEMFAEIERSKAQWRERE